jgi:MFS family permease
MRIKLSKEHKALCCISLAWFLVLSGRYSISNLLPKIVAELHFSWTLAGIGLTSMWLIYAAMQFPSGILSDIKGRKIIIIIAMSIFTISYFLVGISTHYIFFFASLFLLGAGTGAYPAVGISMITDIFKEKRGKALGIRDSAGSLAYIAPILAATIASVYNWRYFFLLWSFICGISIYLFYKGTTESTTLPDQVSIKERVKDGMKIFRNKKIQLVFVVNLLIAITWISYMSFFPSLLVVEKGFTEIQAAIALGILGLGGFIFKPIIGSISDRYNKKLIIIALSSITAIGTLIILQTDSIWIIFLISFIPALATAIFPVISSYLMEQWGEKGRAGKLGFYRSNLIILGSPSSSIIGFLADKYNFIIPFIGISIILFIAALILVINLLFFKQEAGSL